MTWFRIDDSFYDHPKVFDAPDCAVSLWTRAGTWSARNLTDGFVPTGLPARLCGDPETAVKELVRRGLWSRATGGFQFRDWMDYQPSAAEVKALREKRSAAGRQGGLAKARQTSTKSQASASPVGKQNATPSRPVPSFDSGDSSRGGYVSNAGEKKPPQKCPQHENDPNPPACGACRSARLVAEQWQRDNAITAARCALCDGDGWRWHPDGKRHGVLGVRCDHQPVRKASA